MNDLPEELIFRMAIKMNYSDIIEFCSSSSTLKEMCNTSYFWKQKYISEYGNPTTMKNINDIKYMIKISDDIKNIRTVLEKYSEEFINDNYGGNDKLNYSNREKLVHKLTELLYNILSCDKNFEYFEEDLTKRDIIFNISQLECAFDAYYDIVIASSGLSEEKYIDKYFEVDDEPLSDMLELFYHYIQKIYEHDNQTIYETKLDSYSDSDETIIYNT